MFIEARNRSVDASANVNIVDIYRYSGRGRALDVTGARVLQRDATGQLAMISF